MLVHNNIFTSVNIDNGDCCLIMEFPEIHDVEGFFECILKNGYRESAFDLIYPLKSASITRCMYRIPFDDKIIEVAGEIIKKFSAARDLWELSHQP